MELEINGKTYPFKVTFKALNKLNELTKDNGDNVGLAVRYVQLTETGDPTALRDLLVSLNSGLTPSLKVSELEDYLADCEDIEKLAESVADFLMSQGLSRMRLKKVLKKLEETQKD